MIELRMSYYPPVGSAEEMISINSHFSVPLFDKLSVEMMGWHTNRLYTTLQANSAELRKEIGK